MSDESDLPETQEDIEEHLLEVRYSLAELKKRAERERSASVLARELVDQTEISSFFGKRRTKKDDSG